jgi:uncharacterized SAM-binding protein YcdF (DUF218 family)
MTLPQKRRTKRGVRLKGQRYSLQDVSCAILNYSMLNQETISLAKLIWDYHHMQHQPEKADCILVLGSHDLRVAERGAELYLQGWAPILAFSGGLGNFTLGMWKEPEADQFAKVAMTMGVPAEAIIIENKSTNTGENILFTQKLLREKNIDPSSFIVVQKPYMERRSFATFKKHWPDKKLIVTSPQISFEEYPNDEIPLGRVINIMIGDLQRIRMYPEKGFQIPQEIPDNVWEAYERLIELGYDQHLMKET